jgi:hypothetical protein
MKLNLTLKDFIFGAAIAVLCFLLYCSDDKRRQGEHINSVLADSLETTVDDLGRQTATIQNFKLDKAKDLLKIQTNDSTVIWLQGVVEEYKGKLQAALVASSVTSEEGSGKTRIIGGDTIWKDNVLYVYPNYETDWNKRWSEGYILATKDSISWNFKVKNEYEITVGDASNGWFKKRVSEVSFKNLNPNTATTELRSVSVDNKGKKFHVVVYVGYGAGANGLSPQIGIGGGYSLIGVK